MTLSSRQLRLIAVFAAVNVLLAVGGWMALVSPQRHAASTAAAQEQVVQTQLAALSLTTGGPSKQPAIHTANLYTLDTALPAHEQQADMLLQLDRMATAAGVQVVNISPQAVVASTTGFTTQPINLTLKGTYFELTSYLRNLRLLVTRQHGLLFAHGPLFSVGAVAFTPDAATTSPSTSGTPGTVPLATGHAKPHGLLATVGIDAYYYGAVGGATPPAPVTDTTTTSTGG